MDMFQAPTLLEDRFNNTSILHSAEKEPEAERSKFGKQSSFDSMQSVGRGPLKVG